MLFRSVSQSRYNAGKWKGESSAPLQGADLTVVVTKHDSVDNKKILASAPYVFDTTGKIEGAKGL